ncbi:sialate O-acetylesterase [Occallatibacter savannae]|uniref:sialate O-acetylesterase n=1 Tax=Occallatibacter savannae TaxID=1002691 RepID=UPI001EF50AEA|nr:sialate O-acetylesterase [Occallatibacter savannae]
MRLRHLLIFFGVSAAVLSAEVSLPKVLSSHMVVQRDLPVHVWGKAAPGQSVTVAFRGESRTVDADALGHWNAYLRPGAAGGPFSMTVMPGPAREQTAAQAAMTLDDIMVGDVWVASGQSNMEFPLSRASTAAQDLPNSANPQIRLLMIRKRSADYAMWDADTDGWTPSNPETAKDFSAVAWYFARDIAGRQHVTIGLIDATWGGTVGESWVRLTALGEDAALAPIFVSRGKMTDDAADADAEQADEKRQQEEAKAAGKPAPQFPWHPPLNSWGPGLLWNGMIAPLAPLPIRGVLWYQGESNSALARVHSYDRVMRTLIEDWRRQWGIGDFPFLYVQISNFKSTPREDWAELREQQVRTLAMRNTAMAVTIDIGNPDDVHPTDKLDVGLRLARAARALTYGENIEYSGPMFRQATTEAGSIRVWFDHAKGLSAKGGVVTGFEVAGRDGKYMPATAKVEGASVVASSPDVPAPVSVRYGWANSPECLLFNSEGLPASPFTSER